MKPKALLTETSKHLTAIEPHIDRTLKLLEDWGGLGYPTGGSGGSRGGGEPGSSTERAALDATERKDRDRFARERAELVAAITEGEAAFKRAAKIVTTTNNKALVHPPDGCVICCEVRDPLTRKVHESGYQRVQYRQPRPDNPEGPKVAYCSFHGEWIERYGVEPAAEINLWHLEHLGSTIPKDMIRDHHPEEFAVYQSKLAGRPLGLANLDLKAEATS